MERSGGERGNEKKRRLAWNSDEHQNPGKYQSFDGADGHSMSFFHVSKCVYMLIDSNHLGFRHSNQLNRLPQPLAYSSLLC